MDPVALLTLTLFAAAIAYGIWARRHWLAVERRNWEAFAKREGMEFFDGDLPPALANTVRYALPLHVSVRFGVYGRRFGEYVFTLQLRRWVFSSFGGRGGQWITVIGCKQRFPARYQPKRSLLRRTVFEAGWAIASTSLWTVVLLNRREVITAWNALRTTSEEEAIAYQSHVDTSLVIQPRHEVRHPLVRHETHRPRPTDI